MSYNTIATMAHDGDLQQRFIACAAKERMAEPQTWALSNIWQLVSLGTLPNEYESAVLANKRQPGLLEEVLSDADLLSCVQARVAEIAAQEPPA